MGHARTRAFTLTEFAIVIAVAGGIIGAIWGLASQAWENARREQAMEQITATVTNIRSYYTGQVGITDASIALAQQGLFPTNAIRNPPTGCANPGCADAPWGPVSGGAVSPSGTFSLCAWNYGTSTTCPSAPPIASPVQYFAVVISGDKISPGACAYLATHLSSASAPPGLRDIRIKNASNNYISYFPISIATAMAVCGTGGNSMIFVYQLSGT